MDGTTALLSKMPDCRLSDPTALLFRNVDMPPLTIVSVDTA